MKQSLTFLICLFFFSGHAQTIFQKLPGGWQTEAFGGQLHSYWQPDDQGSFTGSSVFIEGADTTYREKLRLFKMDGDWLLVAAPQNADPFVFRAVSVSENEAVFVNERFQNPQNVLYRMEADGTFYRRTEGRNDDGSPVRNEYFFHKMKTSDLSDGVAGGLGELFAPHIISTAAPEFAMTVSPDGKTAFFNRTNDDRSKIYLMQSKMENGGWGAPVVASFSDTLYREVDPMFTPDGKYLFFSSTRPLKGETEPGDFNIWVSPRTATGWSRPQPLGKEVNSGATEIFTSTTKEGHLYFTRMGDGGEREIMRSELKNGKYQPAVAQDILTEGATFGNPAISPDEKFLVYFCEGENWATFGSSDLYICRRNDDGKWAEPLNMGVAVNSGYTEFAPSISPDGKWLYFTSERPGLIQDFKVGERRPGDIYRVLLAPVLEKIKGW